MSDVARPVRLNPFSFPSNTNFFFALLIVAILATSAYIFQLSVYNGVDGNIDEYLAVAEKCITQFGNTTDIGLLFSDVQDVSANLNTCMHDVTLKQAVWTSGGLAIELVVAGLIYWLYPLVKIRRQRLMLVTREEMPELVDALEALSREMGLARLPRYYINPYDLSRNGQAFGRAGRYSVCLPIGLVGELLSGGAEARAVVLHELAHIHNADIDKTYLTISLWYAFLLTALAPFLVWAVRQRVGIALETFWRTAVLVLLVLSIRNAVLRSREYYADLRADLHESARAGLRRALREQHDKESGAPKARVGLWERLAQVHPASAHRLAILEQPSLLFQQPLWVALATGMIFAIGFDSISLFLQSLDSLHPERMALVAGLVFSPLVVGVLGLGLWRAEFARKLTGGARPNTWRIALVLTVGIFLGRWISLTEYINRNSISLTLLDRVVVVIFDLLWVVFLTVVLYLFLRWVEAGSSAWLELALRRPSPRRAYLAGLAAASLLLAPVFGVVFMLVRWGVSAEQAAMALVLFPAMLLTYYMINPLMTTLWVLVWAFPLASLLLLRWSDQNTENYWALLDAPLLVHSARAPALSGRRLLGGVVLVSAACSVMNLALRAGVFALMPEQTRATDGYKIAVGILSLLFTYPFQAAAGAWFASQASQLRLFTGQMGAFVTGLFCGIGILMVNLALGGTLDAFFAWTTLAYTATAGQFVSLPFIYLFLKSRSPVAETQEVMPPNFS